MAFRYVFVGDTLADIYPKCGSIEDVWRMFNEMPIRNVVTWTAMVLRQMWAREEGTGTISTNATAGCTTQQYLTNVIVDQLMVNKVPLLKKT
jgi:hypothetical protein